MLQVAPVQSAAASDRLRWRTSPPLPPRPTSAAKESASRTICTGRREPPPVAVAFPASPASAASAAFAALAAPSVVRRAAKPLLLLLLLLLKLLLLPLGPPSTLSPERCWFSCLAPFCSLLEPRPRALYRPHLLRRPSHRRHRHAARSRAAPSWTPA